MPARARTVWKLSVDGQYVRQIGWTVSRTGKRTQAKFRLGGNRKEAKRRDEIIRQISGSSSSAEQKVSRRNGPTRPWRRPNA